MILFDKELFFKEIIKKQYSITASYNYRIFEPIENFYKSIDIEKYPLNEIEEIDWSASSSIINDIFTQWDGEDDYFSIESLEGIEICPEIKSISVEFLWNVTDLSPLKKLRKLESIYIWSTSNDMVDSLSPLLEIASLKDVFLSDMIFKDQSETDKVIEELKNKGVKVEKLN